MKNCPKCQRSLADDAKFCMYCGATVEEIPEKRFCSNCGAEMIGSFCVMCGTPADGSVAMSVPEKNDTTPMSAPKKKGKGGLIVAIIAIVLVLGLAVSWAFGLFGDGGLFGEGGLLDEDDRRSSSRSERGDRGEEVAPEEVAPEEPTVEAPVVEIPAEPAREQVTLTVWVSDADFEWLEKMCGQFAEAHPEYEITWVFESVSAGDASSFMLANVEAGADVYLYANDQLGGLVEAGALAPVTGAVLQQVRNGNSDTMINSVTYSDAVYGIPVSGNTWWLYYDKSLYSEEDVKSLETMLEKGKVSFPLNNGWYFASFYFANGCTMFGSSGNNAAAGFDFGGDKAVAVTNYLVDLVGHPNFVMDDGWSGAQGFREGTVHAYFSGDWEAGNAKAAMEALGKELGAVQLPTITIDGQTKQLRAFAGSVAVGVNPYAENLDAAQQFAAYLGSAEGQLLRYEINGTIPCDASLADDLAYDPIALAKLNCLNNTSTLQPLVPEMAVWWSPATQFANGIITGAVTHKNAEAETEEFNEILNSGL